MRNLCVFCGSAAGARPAYAASAHALADSRETFLSSGMDEILTKPIRLPELTALLARLPELRRSRDAR